MTSFLFTKSSTKSIKSTPTLVEEKKESLVLYVPPRFDEFFKSLAELLIQPGSEEPIEIKRLRPFLLSTEALGVSNVSARSGQRKKGKGKNKEMGKAWGSGPPPYLNNYIRSNHPFTFTQQYFVGAFLTTSSTVPVFYATYFTSANIDQFSSFAAVFDQYKFDKIETWISSPQPSGNSTQEYASVIDYDDAAALSTFQQALDYTNCVCTQSTDGHYHSFVPHVALAAYSGTFVSYDNVTAPWIDCTSTGVQHYGLKVAAVANSNFQQHFDLNVRITASFRNVR